MDANRNVFLVGTFGGTTDFDPGPGVANRTNVGGFNTFVVKLDPNGNLLWVQIIGGGDAKPAGLTVDEFGSVYLTGVFSGTVDFDPGLGVTNFTTPVGVEDGFVVKLDANGGLVWARELNGTVETRPEQVQVQDPVERQLDRLLAEGAVRRSIVVLGRHGGEFVVPSPVQPV